MPTSRSSYGIKAIGQAWCWGPGIAGTNGDNTLTNRSSPVQVVGGHNFVSVEGSYEHSMGLKDNGQVWCWGLTSYGAIGDNSITGRSSPVLVVGSHSFSQIFSGYQSSAAKKSNGQVWTWGRNNYGQLGINVATQSVSSPVLVVGSHSFLKVLGGSELFFGQKDGGTVWGWGRNEFGQLGDNTVIGKSSPVQIVGNHDFLQVRTSGYHCIALKDNGSAWTWGANSWGQLGTNNLTNYSSPVQVVGSHSFLSVACDYHGSSYGLKVNGQIWAWGCNSYGQLGTNNITSYSSPVLVVGNHSFIGLYTGYTIARGMKASGQIWCWGQNPDGRLGDNSITNRSSPVLVVGSHSFTKLLSGMSFRVNVSTTWRKRPTIFIKIGAAWLRVIDIHVLKSGVWNKTDNLNK